MLLHRKKDSREANSRSVIRPLLCSTRNRKSGDTRIAVNPISMPESKLDPALDPSVRPVTAADIDPLMKLFATGRTDGSSAGSSFDSGIEMGLTAILVSPDFLFRVEHSNGRITDLELASRLSFFLWSSIPDEQLLQAAERGKLHDPAILRQQTLRMLRDPKSQALLDNFAGQWLQLRNIAEWHPDPQKYPQFDEALRHAFERESALFFENIVREDRSVLELIDADYTFVNQRLARYYGIPGVYGSYFRRVPVTSKERGGVLTQGGILMVTSYP